MKRSKQFAKWLKMNKLTTEGFAKRAGVSYNTAVKWRNGVTPRAFVCDVLRPKFPDCPLFA